jgi:dephospho-CoA kinase
MKVVAIVGMPGAGKSEVSRIFEQNGYVRIRFGDITDEEIARRGLLLNEANERHVREQLRQEHGMAAYAILNLPKIEAALKKSNVVIDGLYSWEEYLFLKSRCLDNLYVVAVWASPGTRYRHLSSRGKRPLSVEEAAARDKAEIENVNKGGPIAMADFTITNESSLDDLIKESRRLVAQMR